MSGNGSPAGVITPSQKGALYQDKLTGSLYQAIGTTNVDWLPAGTLWFFSDVVGQAGTGGGFSWLMKGDGSHILNLFLGLSGAFEWKWQEDGTTVFPGPLLTPARESGVLPNTAFVSGTGRQVDTNADRQLIVPITFNPTGVVTSTCKVELSPDNVTYSTLITKTLPALAALAGLIDSVDLMVPAGWWVRLTATNATIGSGIFY